MYINNQKEIVKSYGEWLAQTKWDTFSTITYRYDVKARQNFKIMTGLEEYLKSLDKPFNMFWVTEFTNYNYNTHNHLLVKGYPYLFNFFSLFLILPIDLIINLIKRISNPKTNEIPPVIIKNIP